MIHWRTRTGFHGRACLGDFAWCHAPRWSWPELMAALAARGAVEAWCVP